MPKPPELVGGVAAMPNPAEPVAGVAAMVLVDAALAVVPKAGDPNPTDELPN